MRQIAVLNKVDRIEDKERLLALTAELTKRADFDGVFMISALKGAGVGDLKTYLAGIVPEGPWHYAEDDVTDLPLRMLAAEITRERIYHWLHDELPYAITVETTSWKKLKDGSVRIEQTIFVERESQRASCSARAGRRSRRFRWKRATRSAKLSRRRFTSSCSSKCARIGAAIPSAIARWVSIFRRSKGSRRERHLSLYPDGGLIGHANEDWAALVLVAALLRPPRTCSRRRARLPGERVERDRDRADGAGSQEAGDGAMAGQGRQVGAGFDAWRLAVEKALKCFPKDGGFECVAFGQPCIIQQNPNRRPVGKDGKGVPL